MKHAVNTILLVMALTVTCFAQEYQYPYTSFSERDPLRPLVNDSGRLLIRETGQFGGFALQGIMYSSQGGSAVINNEICVEGDTLAGYTIKKIEEYQVILEKGEEEFILKWEVNNAK